MQPPENSQDYTSNKDLTKNMGNSSLIVAKFKVEKINGEYEVFYNPISVFVPNIIKNFLGD
mgnify:CR=1 FL=1